ncbi:hypothetical protein Slala02_27950 [Streptomyces lavendulae subsp. lavendulae]|nr:hypothetical protein Slala01_31240 [Streptomyces lavendulae subsp. lavendulae]GLX26975.1 hypothetical protein Slala02_27950 [Streptomyces lavendulae subsp. lavendulae]
MLSAQLERALVLRTRHVTEDRQHATAMSPDVAKGCGDPLVREALCLTVWCSPAAWWMGC